MKTEALSQIKTVPQQRLPGAGVPIPTNEPERLQALQRYNILDTLPEVEFDDLTRLAAYICETPMAFISLVDENRQWIKSRIGLDATSTPRDIAFCAHTILEPDLLIVPDAILDERFKNNPLVVNEPKIRFYAGAPLVTSQGYGLGTLCIIDRLPRELSQQQKDALRGLSRQVVSLLELRRASFELEKAHKEMADYNAMIIHDIRSPLVVIAFASAHLQEEQVGPVNEKQKMWLEKIEGTCKRLLYLVNDFLDLSKLKAVSIKVEKQEIDLSKLVDEAIDEFCILIQDKKLSVQSRIAPNANCVFADPYRLAQVLSNLIGNAIKFTPANGTIEVGAKLDSGGKSIIWVKDTGVGIPSHELSRLFKTYQQVSSSQTIKNEGSGLGLMICKTILEAHGGDIWVESQERVGTTFFFTLPATIQS